MSPTQTHPTVSAGATTAAEILDRWLGPNDGYEDVVDLAADFLQKLLDDGRITHAELGRWKNDRRKAARAEAHAYEAAIAAHVADHPEGPRDCVVLLRRTYADGRKLQGHSVVGAAHFAAIVAAADPHAPAPSGAPDGLGLGWDERHVGDWFATSGRRELGRVRFDEIWDGHVLLERRMTQADPAAATEPAEA